MLDKIIGFFANPFIEVGTTLAAGWDARKTAKQDGSQRLEEARQELKVVKIQASIDAAKVVVQNDSNYDNQVLNNRTKTYADELLIFIFMGIFLMHFIPSTQPYMAEGWVAMGYSDGPAWFFEFALVGILVSTLGLMGLFRIMMGAGGKLNPAKWKDKT
jgi:hypothetical protein